MERPGSSSAGVGNPYFGTWVRVGVRVRVRVRVGVGVGVRVRVRVLGLGLGWGRDGVKRRSSAPGASPCTGGTAPARAACPPPAGSS